MNWAGPTPAPSGEWGPGGRNLMSHFQENSRINWTFMVNTFVPCCRGCRPSLVAVDDILFQKPVEIGSLLLLSSQVGPHDCYSHASSFTELPKGEKPQKKSLQITAALYLNIIMKL